MIAGNNTINIEDNIENAGFTTQPFMMLYHMNFGWPLVNENSFITPTAHQVTPQGEVAAAGMDKWDKMSLPTLEFAEEVFYHDIPADENGMAHIHLTNPDEKVRLTLSCSKAQLPFFAEWKQMGQGEYVLGLEPANCVPENQNGNREKGILRTIAPGETVSHEISVTLEKLA